MLQHARPFAVQNVPLGAITHAALDVTRANRKSRTGWRCVRRARLHVSRGCRIAVIGFAPSQSSRPWPRPKMSGSETPHKWWQCRRAETSLQAPARARLRRTGRAALRLRLGSCLAEPVLAVGRALHRTYARRTGGASGGRATMRPPALGYGPGGGMDVDARISPQAGRRRTETGRMHDSGEGCDTAERTVKVRTCC